MHQRVFIPQGPQPAPGRVLSAHDILRRAKWFLDNGYSAARASEITGVGVHRLKQIKETGAVE